MSVLESFVQNYKNCSLRYISDSKVLLSSSDIVNIKTLEKEDVLIENLGDGWVFGEGSSVFNAGKKVSSEISEKIEGFVKSYYFVDVEQTLLVSLSNGRKYMFSVVIDESDESDVDIESFKIKDIKTKKYIEVINECDDFYVLEYCNDILDFKKTLIINEEMINILNYYKDKISNIPVSD